MTQRVAALVLAAGPGARMRSTRPKPVHLLCGRPMVAYVLDALLDISPRRAVVVVGGGAEVVTKKVAAVAPDFPLSFVEQRVARGTGDAVAVGLTAFDDDYSLNTADIDDAADDVIVVPGDMPLLRRETIRALLAHHREQGNAATLLAAPSQITGGRHLIRGRDEQLVAVYDDAVSPDVATGVGVYRRSLLAPAIRRITPRAADGLFDLDAVIEVLAETGHPVGSLMIDDPSEVVAVDDRNHLAEAEAILRNRTNTRWLSLGVTMLDPARTYIDTTVDLGADVTLFPGTMLQGNTVVGSGAEIGPDTRLVDCAVGDNAVVESTTGRDAEIGPGAHVGPYAMLHPGAQVPADTQTGAFFTAESSEHS